ncbi:hypothetical protein PLESTB_000971500 [Pleodorina starrii]|uniref:Uncharacterized protein n=1 Tax=Pleodorina starrii TaxID=330485 RepID=A0A9W6BNH5_9CHLO|nr:hypothetical protein PLESTB_000971500 [Pleodorina starrii]
MADAGKTATTSGQDIDVVQLSKDPEKIKILMKRDPKFITRLITQLDKSMHALILEKMRRREAIAAAEKEIEQINETIRTHVKPNLERLDSSIVTKRELRDNLAKEIDASLGNVSELPLVAARTRARPLENSDTRLQQTQSAAWRKAVGTAGGPDNKVDHHRSA